VPLEESGYTVHQYNALSSIYFFPNIAVPIIAGVVAHMLGSASTFSFFCLISALGNMFVAVSATPRLLRSLRVSSYNAMLVGRLCMGVAYEALDFLPIGMVAPRFSDK